MQAFPLANVLLTTDNFTKDYPHMYYHADSAFFDVEHSALSFTRHIDFITYFNALSLRKWKRYTNFESAWLHLELTGDACDVRFVELCKGSSTPSIRAEKLAETGRSNERVILDIKLPSSTAPLVAFALNSRGKTTLHKAHYYTKVDASALREVRLALCTTTFMKEDYIVPNVDAVKQMLKDNDPISKGFHMYVVDNGQTLDPDSLSDKNITVLSNPNVGGAGGFARGMIEALEKDATHILLMDDDVRVLPESFKRTFNLLSLINKRYENAFLNGAMLSFEHPNLQFEDVAFVRKDGLYDRVKPYLKVDTISGILSNETIEVEHENGYGAWWYCCIPAVKIREHGLPLPVFVRCDDVEYGMRCQPTMMTMGGVCVWHASFEGRGRASVDCYQYVRNFLIMIAVDNKSSERLFMLRLYRTFAINLRAMAYESAELLLDGLEDYLKGPDFLANADGAALMKENGLKNEHLVPVEEIDAALLSQLDMRYAELGTEDRRGLLLKLLEALPHDRHMLPHWLLKSKPAPVYYCRGAYPGWKTMRRKTLVAFDKDAKHAKVRVMDKDRYKALKKRYRHLTKEYKLRKAELQQAYQKAVPRLTSQGFWREYLGLD